MQKNLADFERRIAEDRSVNYQDTALIRLEVLACKKDDSRWTDQGLTPPMTFGISQADQSRQCLDKNSA